MGGSVVKMLLLFDISNGRHLGAPKCASRIKMDFLAVDYLWYKKKGVALKRHSPLLNQILESYLELEHR